MKVAGLILAAGGGSRLGAPKAGVTVGGRRLVDIAVAACLQAGLSPVVVVLGAVWLTPLPLAVEPSDDVDAGDSGDSGDEKNHGGLGDGEVWLVDNTEWASGMASSLKAGLAALDGGPDIDAVVVTLVDTPYVGVRHLQRLRSILRDGATVAVATYEGMARTPVGLTRQVWADVAGTVAGDQGARGWLRAHPRLVTDVECADLGPWIDIDVPADLPD